MQPSPAHQGPLGDLGVHKQLWDVFTVVPGIHLAWPPVQNGLSPSDPLNTLMTGKFSFSSNNSDRAHVDFPVPGRPMVPRVAHTPPLPHPLSVCVWAVWCDANSLRSHGVLGNGGQSPGQRPCIHHCGLEMSLSCVDGVLFCVGPSRTIPIPWWGRIWARGGGSGGTAFAARVQRTFNRVFIGPCLEFQAPHSRTGGAVRVCSGRRPPPPRAPLGPDAPNGRKMPVKGGSLGPSRLGGRASFA